MALPRERASLMRIALALLLIVAVCHLRVGAHDHEHEHEHEEEDDEDYSKVTYGSALKLLHVPSKFRLHSHQIQWGSGSGQQSVTGFQGSSDPNSLWQVKEAFASSEVLSPGTPVKCGDVIRLHHAQTKRFLHSHNHASPLTGRGEISGYGDDSGNLSDTGDNWRVECKAGQKWWERDAPVSFLHIDTNKRLYSRRADMFNQRNCGNCPILNQLEISGHQVAATDANAQWRVEDGIFFPVAQD